MTALPLEFYRRSTLTVARALLGQVLCHRIGTRTELAGRIVETEAYVGPKDLACHSSKGRTPRTEVMFGEAGRAYVFLIYGMHWCFNVVTGNGCAVLIRALEPLSAELPSCSGPGRLTRALGIDKTHNGLCLATSPLRIVAADAVPSRDIARGPRVGVDYAGLWASKPYRFWLKRNRHVSGAVASVQRKTGVTIQNRPVTGAPPPD